MNKEFSTELYSAGIDALTFTMLNRSDEAQWVRSLFQRYLEEDLQTGNDVKVMKPQGFEGVGSRHLFYGQRKNYNLFECRTARADEIAAAIRAGNIPIRATRIDWQVTYKGKEEATSYYKGLRSRIEKAATRLHGKAPAESSSYGNPNGACSVYVATTDKGCLSRSYNKAVESPGQWPLDARRHELQLRHKRAKNSFQQYRISGNSEYMARSMLHGHLLQYGIVEKWMRDTAPIKAVRGNERSDTAKRLEWFIATAVPVAKKLMDAGIDLDTLIQHIKATQD